MIEGFEPLPIKYQTTCSTDNNSLQKYSSDITNCIQCKDNDGNICNKNESGSCSDPCFPTGIQTDECSPQILLLNFFKTKKEACQNYNIDVQNYNNWYNTQHTSFINELNTYMVDYEGKIGNEFYIDPDSTRPDGIIINSTNCGTDACTGPDLCNSNLSGNNPDCTSGNCDSVFVTDNNSPLSAAADYNNYRWNSLCPSEGCADLPVVGFTGVGCDKCPRNDLSNATKAQLLRDSFFYDLNDNQYQKKKYECRLNDNGIDNQKQLWADQNTTNPGHPNNQPPVRDYDPNALQQPSMEICQNITKISGVSNSNIHDLKQSCNIGDSQNESIFDSIIQAIKDILNIN